jgi:hypothetical protein
MDTVSRNEAMASMDKNINKDPGSKAEYEALGHDVYFDKYGSLDGFTKEQFEVVKRKWGKKTWEHLFSVERGRIDRI